MVEIELPPDFAAFLRLLNEANVEYMVIGGFAVAHHGYVRSTGDLDLWVRTSVDNAQRLAKVVADFGFPLANVTADLFLEPDRIVRMGESPVRIEIHTSISGVTFDDCWDERESGLWADLPVTVLSLHHLKENKRASGRLRDIADLEFLPK